MNRGPQGPLGILWSDARREITAIIGVWFLVYVVVDLLSTYWLVTNTSVGIVGETNPLGLALYRSLGYGGMIAGKLIAFALMSVATLLLDGKYHSIPWFRGVEKILLLSLVSISSIAAVLNFGSLVTVAYQRGEVQSLSPLVNLLSLILAFGLAYLPGRLIRFQGGFKFLVAVAGALVLASPLLYFKDIFAIVLQQVPAAIAAYVVAGYAVVAGFIYVTDEFRRRAD